MKKIGDTFTRQSAVVRALQHAASAADLVRAAQWTQTCMLEDYKRTKGGDIFASVSLAASVIGCARTV